MKELLKYLKNYKRESIIAPLFKLLEAAFELIVPLIIAKIIDIGIEGANRPYVLKMCGVLVLLGIVGLACSLTAQYYAAKAAVGFGTEIRSQLFSHIGKLSYSQLDTIGTPTLITRLTGDTNQVQSGVNLTLRLLLRAPIVVFGAMFMAFTVDVKSAFVFVVAVPVLALVVFSIMIATIPLYRKVQGRLDTVLSKTRENLRGTRVIRAFCKEDSEISGFEAANSDLTKMQIVVSRISSFMNPVTLILINIAIAVLIYTGALRVESGAITKGQVVALYNYMSQILVELIKLASLIISITKAIACGNRIQSVLAVKPNIISGNIKNGENGDKVIEFSDVSLAYNSEAENALQDISFTVKRSSTVGIIGSTGSGKSSLINLIPRFYEATSGKIKVDGISVKDYDVETLRSKIGIVPQKAVLFNGTIRENMKIGKEDATDEEIFEALTTAQALETVNGKPGGLDYVIEQEGKNLSGGQKQRLTIARALVKKPEILILDDSSSALDYATAAALKAALRNTDFAPTVIVVSQRTSAVSYADSIIVLDDGRISGIGTNDELLDTCEVYKEILNSQIGKEDKKNA